MGLGMAYTGTNRQVFLISKDLFEILLPLVSDPNLSCEIAAFASLSMGLIFIG